MYRTVPKPRVLLWLNLYFLLLLGGGGTNTKEELYRQELDFFTGNWSPTESPTHWGVHQLLYGGHSLDLTLTGEWGKEGQEMDTWG